MVPQGQVHAVNLVDAVAGDSWYIHRCLPGQHDIARKWYDFLAETLRSFFGATPCFEQPSVFKVSDKGFLLARVDDILFFMDQSFLENTFIPKLKEKFKMVVNYVTRSGGSFEFLKKTFEMERDYKKITVHPETKHVWCKHQAQQWKSCTTLHNAMPPTFVCSRSYT